MLPVRPGWGPGNDPGNHEIPYKTWCFLMDLIISGTPMMTAHPGDRNKMFFIGPLECFYLSKCFVFSERVDQISESSEIGRTPN